MLRKPKGPGAGWAVRIAAVVVALAFPVLAACGASGRVHGKTPQGSASQLPPADGQRVLSIVAHHDDDVLFLSPQLVQALASGATVRTVYLVASDYEDYPKYMESREEGVRYAYAQAVGMPESDWKEQPYQQGGVQATLWTLGDRVSILETRIPDGGMRTAPDAARMWNLYALDHTVTTRPGDTFPAQTLNRDQVVAYLRGVAAEFKPTSVDTLDPVADLKGPPAYGYHQDHIAVARLVMYAYQGTPLANDVQYWRDYSIQAGQPNLTPQEQAMKQRLFQAYAKFDPDAAKNKAYPPWLTKTFPADAAWRGDLVIPLPPPDGYGAATAPTPYLGKTYTLVNRATGMALAVDSPGQSNSVALLDKKGTPLETRATRGGWQFAAGGQGSTKCIQAADGGTQPGTVVRQGDCGLGPEQALRLRGTQTAGYTLTFADSGLALTTGERGGVLTEQAVTGAPDQLWDLEPVG